MMKPQILESAYSSKTQKYKYLDNETLFYLEAKQKNHPLYSTGYNMAKISSSFWRR